VSLPPTRTSRP